MSKAIAEHKEDQRRAAGVPGGIGPSVTVEDEPTFARILGLVGGVLAIVGVVCWGMFLAGKNVALPPGWAILLFFIGTCGVLFHAAIDKDVQFRLVYLILGAFCLAAGVFLALIPFPASIGDSFNLGLLGMFAGLMFVAAVLRNETDPSMRNVVQLGLLGVGGLMAAAAFIIAVIMASSVPFHFPVNRGLLEISLWLGLLGLLYLLAFVSSRGTADNLAYLAGQIAGYVGVAVFLLAFARSVLPPLFHHLKWTSAPGNEYFIPDGLLWMGIGLIYAAASFLICSDRPLAAMTRRELGAFFYSPMAYIVLFGFAVVSWGGYLLFVNQLLGAEQAVMEPIVRFYFFSLLPVITMVFVVPVLTMRLLSEERRAGTMEVLLTAPVEEPVIVLSKFFAGLIMFLVVWIPFFLLLGALYLGGKAFDLVPLLGFLAGLVFAGMGFVSMGLFFSSLTRNQVASGVLTFAGMLSLTMAYILKEWLKDEPSMKGVASFLVPILRQVSYLDYWRTAFSGQLLPGPLVFFASMTIFFLFTTVKVLESRKWW
jgi:ABC-type transport system involved in multi-copper enzyme maturation permease subunit